MTRVHLPYHLRTLARVDGEVEVPASTVGEVLDALYERHGDLRARMQDGGSLRRFVNVYLGGEDIRFLDGLETEVGEGAEVTILPAVAGG